MTLTVSHVGHPSLRVADLAPGHSPAFSPNLYRYLKRHGMFWREGGLVDAVYRTMPDTPAATWFGPDTLMIGFLDSEFFTGARLMSVLCNGVGADRGAYACVDGFALVEGFWERYLEVGRCAIDPAHQESFQADRFHEAGEVRSCRWCGHQQQRVVTPRVVYDTSWVSITQA